MSTASETLSQGRTGRATPATSTAKRSRLLLRPAPHIHAELTAVRVMRSVVIALLPAAVAAVALFGLGALIVILSCVAASLATEVLCLRLRGKQVQEADKAAAVVTGLLLALTLPSNSPVWMCILGGLVAIGLGKHAFGGLGANPFNPALVARVFLFISFPSQMTAWVLPLDGTTGATPLVTGAAATSYLDLFLGRHAGSLGETSALALLLGAAYLFHKGIIGWHTPVGMLGSAALMALLFGADPLFHLLTGGMLIGAFFMATDWVTSPVTKSGRLIYGIGIGLVSMVIRLWGNYPEGVSFAILFMNALTPLLNEWTRPHPQTQSVRETSKKSNGQGGLLTRILVVMAVVAALSGGVLALFFGMMNPRIVERQAQEMRAAFQLIYPQAETFTPVELQAGVPAWVSDIHQVFDAAGRELGIAFIAKPPGFQGDITVALGVNPQTQAIVALRILAHTETAGLGSKVAEPAYLDQFAGKPVSDDFLVKRDVDGISGATVSSAAVANGVRDSARAVLKALAAEN